MATFNNSFGLFIIVYCLSSEVAKTDNLNFHTFHGPEKSKMPQTRGKRQTTRVLNGEIVAPHEFPQLAEIYYNGRNRCVGTIVTKDWVLCSGFCVSLEYGYVPDLSRFRVIVGHHNLSVWELSQQNLSVLDVVVNQHYSKARTDHDLALIRVEPSIKFNSRVHPTNLPVCGTSPSPGTIATVVGTGKYFDDKYLGNYSDVPRKGTVIIRSYEDCRKFPQYSFAWSRKNLCSFNNETSGPCDGDMGAPLFIWRDNGADGKQKTLVQVGVAVGTVGAGVRQNCTESAFIYTDLAYYAGWIHRRVSGCGNFPYNTKRYPGQTTFRRTRGAHEWTTARSGSPPDP